MELFREKFSKLYLPLSKIQYHKNASFGADNFIVS